MKNVGVLLVALVVLNVTARRVQAQEKEFKPADRLAEATATPPKEGSSVTDHTLKIAGQTIPYKAAAATILIKNDKDEPTARELADFSMSVGRHAVRGLQPIYRDRD